MPQICTRLLTKFFVLTPNHVYLLKVSANEHGTFSFSLSLSLTHTHTCLPATDMAPSVSLFLSYTHMPTHYAPHTHKIINTILCYNPHPRLSVQTNMAPSLSLSLSLSLSHTHTHTPAQPLRATHAQDYEHNPMFQPKIASVCSR